MEFGRRLAGERVLMKAAQQSCLNAGKFYVVRCYEYLIKYTHKILTSLPYAPLHLVLVFDESGHFLIYPTIFGIKVVNTHSNKVVRLIGKSEPQRFMNIALYQGAPKKKSNMTMV